MPSPTPQPYRLYVLGTRELRGPDGDRVSSVLAQPKRLCLLTYLALASEPVARGTLVALFWPEKDEARARNALSQALHYIRRSMTKDVIVEVEGDMIRVPPERVWCDARELLDADPPDRADLAAAGHDLMKGWNADDSQPLQEWLDRTRQVVRERAAQLSDGRALPPEPAPSQRPSRSVLPGAVLAAVALVAVLLLRTLLGGAGASSPAPVLAVLAPTPVDHSGRGPSGLSDLIHATVLAELSGIEGVTVQDASVFNSVAIFNRQLQAIGQESGPDLFLQIFVVLTRERFATTAFLTGPNGVSETNRSHEIEFESVDDLVWRAPGDVSQSVARMVRDELARRSGRR